MARQSPVWLLGIGILLAGCSESPSAPSVAAPATDASAADPATDAPAAAPANGTAQPSPPTETTPATATPVQGTPIELSPANTSIGFVGNHAGDDPNPRQGSFTQFRGTAIVDGPRVKSIRVEIDTASLTTDIEKLTNHLKNADFFAVNQYPQAVFQSTSIVGSGDGGAEISGDLTLLGQTHNVTFPAVLSTEEGLQLKAGMVLDRTRWGMDYGLDKVEKMVELTITIGG